jgi:hypothetical protein
MGAFIMIVGGLLTLFFVFLGFVRNEWVFRQRGKWIDLDVYHFHKHAPSYNSMVLRFWIWDMKKFGCDKELK